MKTSSANDRMLFLYEAYNNVVCCLNLVSIFEMTRLCLVSLTKPVANKSGRLGREPHVCSGEVHSPFVDCPETSKLVILQTGKTQIMWQNETFHQKMHCLLRQNISS